MPRARSLSVGPLLMGVASIAAPALSAPLLVSPTTIQLAPGRHGATLTVENDGDTPVDLQLTAFGWSQRDGADLLAETDAVVVSPAIATVAAHGRQLFRVLERAAADAGPERTYRLRLAELPNASGSAVAVRVSFLLPMFGGGGAAVLPSWTLNDGQLTVANEGGRRLRLDAVSLRLADGRELPVRAARPTYLLAGQRRSWPIAAPGAGARLVGTSDGGPFDVPAPATTLR